MALSWAQSNGGAVGGGRGVRFYEENRSKSFFW